MNQVQLVGRATAAPETRETSNGKQVANFTLAVDRSKEHTDFFRIQCWDKTAHIATSYIQKGRMIGVTGSLAQNRWQDKDGNNRSTVEVNAFRVYLLGPPTQHDTDTPSDASTSFADMVDPGSNLPF